MRRLVLGSVLALGVVAALATPAPAQTIDTGEPAFCLEPYPAALTPPPFSEPIDLRVLVLLDGVPEAVADAAMQTASVAYAPIALRVKTVQFRPVRLTEIDAGELIAESRAAVGGGRPAGADLVYTFTDKDITGGAAGDAVAGMADCIGGVAFAESAFAVGEADDSQDLIAAHELGHLMGAHHHYANCTEAICTLMINDVGLANMTFSTLNASVVRGHAEGYLPGEPHPGAPPVAEPEPEPEPEPESQSQSQPSPPPEQQHQEPPPPPPPAQPAPPVQAGSDSQAQRRCRTARRRAAGARRRLRAARRSGARRAVVRRRAAAARRAQRLATRACG